jgi:hypothetical protein
VKAWRGKPHTTFERRTVASVRATLCATSDPTPAKQPNKSGRPPAEVVEGRTLTKENMDNETRAEPRVGKAGQMSWTMCGKPRASTLNIRGRNRVR